jgi:hypothetical protein
MGPACLSWIKIKKGTALPKSRPRIPIQPKVFGGPRAKIFIGYTINIQGGCPLSSKKN